MLNVLYLKQRDCIVFENEEIDKYPISVEEVASDKENSEWGISCVGRINNLLKRILHGANYSFARRPKLFATHRHQMKFFFFESENSRPPIGLGLWLALSTSLANEVFEDVLNLLVIEAAEKRVAEISTGSAVHWPLQASPAVTTTTNIQVTDQELIDEVFKVVSSEQKIDILTECVVDQAIRSFEYEEVLKDQLEVFIYELNDEVFRLSADAVENQQFHDSLDKVVTSEQKIDFLTECVVHQVICSFEYEEVLRDRLEFLYIIPTYTWHRLLSVQIVKS